MVRAQLIQLHLRRRMAQRVLMIQQEIQIRQELQKQKIQIIPKTIIQTAQMILNHKLIKRIRIVMDQIVLIAAKQQILLITD